MNLKDIARSVRGTRARQIAEANRLAKANGLPFRACPWPRPHGWRWMEINRA